MKLLLDEHLSRKLVPLLEAAFPGTSHIVFYQLESKSDDELWSSAKAGGFTILTKDEDFQLLSFVHGHPPKVIWLRRGNAPTRDVLATLLQYRQFIEEFDADPDRSLLALG